MNLLQTGPGRPCVAQGRRHCCHTHQACSSFKSRTGKGNRVTTLKSSQLRYNTHFPSLSHVLLNYEGKRAAGRLLLGYCLCCFYRGKSARKQNHYTRLMTVVKALLGNKCDCGMHRGCMVPLPVLWDAVGIENSGPQSSHLPMAETQPECQK